MEVEPMETQTSLNPRMIILRGIFSMVFGLLVLIWPVSGLISIAIVYGAYAFADGILALTTGVRRERHHQSWGLFVLEGVLGIGAGVVTLLWPGITLFVLSICVGAWALITGVLEVMAALRLKSQAARSTRILLGLAGLCSITLGIAIFMVPPLGAITLLTFVATYSLIFGGLLLAFGLKVRRQQKSSIDNKFPRAA